MFYDNTGGECCRTRIIGGNRRELSGVSRGRDRMPLPPWVNGKIVEGGGEGDHGGWRGKRGTGAPPWRKRCVVGKGRTERLREAGHGRNWALWVVNDIRPGRGKKRSERWPTGKSRGKGPQTRDPASACGGVTRKGVRMSCRQTGPLQGKTNWES